MPKGETEVDKFFENLPSEDKKEVDIFEVDEKKGDAEKIPAKDGDASEEDGPRKNRRHRRLETQLQQERELRIAAEARAAGQSEAQKFQKETAAVDDVPDKWLRIYGDNDNARIAWKLQKEMMNDYGKQVRDATIAEIDERQNTALSEQRKFEEFIDSGLEAVEDAFDVDVTSDSPAARKARREFLDLVQRISPKDQNGMITEYADFGETWKIYQEDRSKEKVNPDLDKQKQLADRSMRKAGDSGSVEKQQTPGFHGWKRDYNIT